METSFSAGHPSKRPKTWMGAIKTAGHPEIGAFFWMGDGNVRQVD